MSIGLYCHDDSWSADRRERTVKVAGLHRGDVSLVVHPANDLASAELLTRSAAQARRPPLPDHTTPARERLALLRLGVNRSRPRVADPTVDRYEARLAELRKRAKGAS